MMVEALASPPQQPEKTDAVFSRLSGPCYHQQQALKYNNSKIYKILYKILYIYIYIYYPICFRRHSGDGRKVAKNAGG